jgi:hypothetical protein
MAGSPLIVALAVLMLVYWYRYACALVLSTRTEPGCVARVAMANGLTFLMVRTQLQAGEVQLDTIRKSLDSDYKRLLYLLRQSRGPGLGSIEMQLLLSDHRMMRIWYWLVRGISADQARKALQERSRILAWLAHEVGRTLPADGGVASHATIMSWHLKQRSSQQSADLIKFAAKSPKSLSARTMSSKAS